MNGSRKQANTNLIEEISVRDDLQEQEDDGPQQQLFGGGQAKDYKPDYPQQQQRDGSAGYRLQRGIGGGTIVPQQQFYLRDSSQGLYTGNAIRS